MPRWKVNLLALVGAVLGVAAIFSAWLGAWIINVNITDILNDGGTSSDYWPPSTIFIVGALAKFLSPLGGVLEFVDAPWFILVYANKDEGRLLGHFKPCIGIASGTVLMTSIVRPIELGLAAWPFSIKSRLLSFSRTNLLPQKHRRRVLFDGCHAASFTA